LRRLVARNNNEQYAVTSRNRSVHQSAHPEELRRPALPRDCTFSESDWLALAPSWYPIAFSQCGLAMYLHSGASARAISSRLRLHMFGVRECFGLVWVQLVNDDSATLPEMTEWLDPGYIQILPDSVAMNASAGK
jgi:hypothetical protein